MTTIAQKGFGAMRSGNYRASMRFEKPADGSRDLRQVFDSTKGLSAMLLAAMVSALIVVGAQLMNSWADGHLLAAWVALWLVGFAALAVFAGAARRLAATTVAALNAWSRRIASARADARLWEVAKTDPRVMAELTSAMTRYETF